MPPLKRHAKRSHEGRIGLDTRCSESYESLVEKYSRPIPHKSFLRCCADSLAILQEFSLSVFFLARYQLSICWEKEKDQRNQHEARLYWAHVLILIGFTILLVMRLQTHQLANTGTKARHRLTDACLLGVLLRLLASVLRRLTASYSTDTVERLTMASMGLHLLTCDYTYSSGGAETKWHENARNRPPFRGGTVSLNASFFATILCISRLDSDVTSYFYCSLAVIFFAFYPQTRAEMLQKYPPHQSIPMWLITLALLAATFYLLGDETSRLLYCVAVVTLLILLPVWSYTSRQNKRCFMGPWSLPTNLYKSTQGYD